MVELTGGCGCGQVRYRMMEWPLFTHCCHCSWCQRETGSAFVLNALIETDLLKLKGEAEEIHTPSASGKGQKIIRCSDCHIAIYSHYSGAGPRFAFLRVGTLDDPACCPPDVHIFTSTKLPWVILSGNIPVMEEYYDREALWPAASLERRKVALAQG
ncbi:GFA family protein [Paracoccus alkanivorans]|uniref:GFA family protein n=1 Tax=Paracoccus alkanivorans TaxID=2116655 RepID=A0A3M0LYY8_9RHOB|nr:GFA family protein [Paracoccus alkanivorans]RMC30586.1 GFA family protein [Paracoccus alkanivorans]